MGGEDTVVGLHDGGGDLGGGVDGETHFAFLAVVHGETLEEEGAETGAGAPADGVEHEEALETGAVVREFTDAVEAEVDDFFADGVVPAGVVVGGVLFAGDELLGVEQLAVGPGADLVDYGGLEVDEQSSGDVTTGTGFRKEGVEGVVLNYGAGFLGHGAVGVDAVLKAVEFPAGVTGLDTRLTEVDGDYFTH